MVNLCLSPLLSCLKNLVTNSDACSRYDVAWDTHVTKIYYIGSGELHSRRFISLRYKFVVLLNTNSTDIGYLGRKSVSRRRWEYGQGEFKLRRLLERRRFTRVHSEDSDDEPAPMLPHPPANAWCRNIVNLLQYLRFLLLKHCACKNMFEGESVYFRREIRFPCERTIGFYNNNCIRRYE